nr:pyridoxamine 5'-phosphate oxidase family protein [Arthrobacter crusticola]
MPALPRASHRTAGTHRVQRPLAPQAFGWAPRSRARGRRSAQAGTAQGALHASAALSPDECWALLSTRRTSRIGFMKEGSLYIFPVNYLVHDGGIYFRTSEEGDLGRAPLGSSALQVDDVQAEAMAGWTVLAQGRPEQVDDEDLLKTLWGRSTEEP